MQSSDSEQAPFEVDFEKSISEMVESHKKQGWVVKTLNDNQATLEVRSQAGKTHEMVVSKHGAWIKIAAASDYAISEDDQGEGALELLEFNASSNVGFWGLSQATEPSGAQTWCYTVIRNERLETLDKAHFCSIIHELAEECESLEEAE